MQRAGLGLSHVSIAAPERRVDVALPSRVPLAELLPSLLQHAGDHLADEGEQHGGWMLRRADGTELDSTKSLANHPIRDGEVLHLVPARTEWPETNYDDVVEAIASGARSYSRSWTPRATRVLGLGASGVALGLGLVMAFLSPAEWRASGPACMALAVILMITGLGLSRAMSDAVAGAVLGGFALPYAFAGGLLLLRSPLDPWPSVGGAQVLIGGALLLVFGIVGYLAVGAYLRVFVAGMMAGLFLLIGGALWAGTLPSAGAAAVLVSLLMVALSMFPMLSIRLGHLPVPALPRSVEDLRATTTAARTDQVFDMVVRADEVLTGLFLGGATVAVVCSVPLLVGGGWAGATVVALVAGTLLLRARLFATVRQRLPLLVSGGVMLAVLLVSLLQQMPATVRPGVALGVALLVGLLATVAALVYSRRPPSPYLGRIGDILDTVLVIAVVPMACAVLDVYGWARGLAG